MASKQSDGGVQDDHHAIAAHGVTEACCRACASPPPARAPRAVAREPARVYQAKTSVREVAGDDVGERGLFDGEERADFVAAGADDADGAGDDQEEEIVGGGEGESRGGHEHRADDEHAAAADAVGAGGEIERDDDVAGEGEAEDQAGLRFGEAEAHEVKNQNDGQRAVGEQAREAREEQQPAVAAHGAKCGGDEIDHGTAARRNARVDDS